MGIVIGAKPDSSFADPLGLLSDCHRRIEKFLQMLITLVFESQASTLVAQQKRNLENEGGGVHAIVDCDLLKEEQRQTLEVALRYFREAAPRHTRDEEESLFPKVRSRADAAGHAALAAIDALEADHETADKGHAEVDRLGRQWLANGRLSKGETTVLFETLLSLQTLYQNHIEIEDTQIFPLAGRVLDAPTIQAIGREMAERRGIDMDSIAGLKLRCPTRRTDKGEVQA